MNDIIRNTNFEKAEQIHLFFSQIKSTSYKDLKHRDIFSKHFKHPGNVPPEDSLPSIVKFDQINCSIISASVVTSLN